MDNLEDLLTRTNKNFKLAEEQYLESDENTDPSLKKLRKMNYDNAANILNVAERMAGKEETVQKNNPRIKEEHKPRNFKVANGSQPKVQLKDNATKLQFPTYDEIEKATVKTNSDSVSTSTILREAARQSFMGKSSSKKAAKKQSKKKLSSSESSEAGMTREEYRKRHGKKN